MSRLERIGIVGAGFMGSGIAESCARAGLQVVVEEPESTALARSRELTEYAPPPLLRRMVVSGAYGRKSGRGFSEYQELREQTVAKTPGRQRF